MSCDYTICVDFTLRGDVDYATFAKAFDRLYPEFADLPEITVQDLIGEDTLFTSPKQVEYEFSDACTDLCAGNFPEFFEQLYLAVGDYQIPLNGNDDYNGDAGDEDNVWHIAAADVAYNRIIEQCREEIKTLEGRISDAAYKRRRSKPGEVATNRTDPSGRTVARHVANPKEPA